MIDVIYIKFFKNITNIVKNSPTTITNLTANFINHCPKQNFNCKLGKFNFKQKEKKINK